MAMVAEAYGLLLAGLTNELKGRGFSRQGSSFYLRKGNNWGLINFQKSTKSTADSILFTVNLGVASERLRRFFSGQKAELPGVSACHWSMRLGFLQAGRDKWWTVDRGTVLDLVEEEIRHLLLERGIPEIEKHVDDASLRDLWLAGRSPGLTEIQRLMNLVVVLEAIGPTDALEVNIEKLREKTANKPTAGRVTWLLSRMRNTADVTAHPNFEKPEDT
jgi:Domain of unknown function (DUF4304)